jgi:hypothetical protein
MSDHQLIVKPVPVDDPQYPGQKRYEISCACGWQMPEIAPLEPGQKSPTRGDYLTYERKRHWHNHLEDFGVPEEDRPLVRGPSDDEHQWPLPPTGWPPGGLISELADRESRKERARLLYQTVAKGATEDELEMLVGLADRYNLDPFAREIWCKVDLDEMGERKTDEHGEPYPALILVGRDGLLKIANSRSEYDGMICDVVHQNDDFTLERTPDNPGALPAHRFEAGDRGKVIGAYAFVFRSDRKHPAYFYAPWLEYGEPNLQYRDRQTSRLVKRTWSPWYRYPSAMILKVAQAVALKQAFSISGVLAEEEIDAGQAIEEGSDGAVSPRQRGVREPELGAYGRVKPRPFGTDREGRPFEESAG